MSYNTHLQLKTPVTPRDIRTALVQDKTLADLGLVDRGEEDGLFSHSVGLFVLPWDDEDRHMITGGFQTGSATVTIIPRSGTAGDVAYKAQDRVVASLLRLVPGDVCLAGEGSAAPGLLRLGGTIYVNPDGFRPESLATNGYAPERVVVGIPTQAAGAAAE